MPQKISLRSMKRNNTPNLMLPAIVYQMCVHGALLAGSLARKIADQDNEGEFNDYDLLVPLEKWQIVALLIPKNSRPNKFGGWRFRLTDGKEVDVWPDTLENYLAKCKTKIGKKVCVIDFIHNKLYSSEIIKI